ncbi:MAG: TolC family protein [Bacteroidota bacterium]
MPHLKSIVLLAAFAATAVTAQPLLTPADVQVLVLEQNPAVSVAQFEAEIAETDAALGTAGFLPSFQLRAIQRRQPLFRAGFDGIAFRSTFDATANASVTIFEGLSRVARYRRLQALADAAGFEAEATREAILADALVAYFDVARQQEQIEALQEAVQLSEERLRIASDRESFGASSELEVRRALVDLNADRAGLLRQQNLLAGTKALLARLIGRPDMDFAVIDTVLVDTTLQITPLLADALADAPDLLAAQSGVDAADQAETAVQRELWPRVDLTAGYVFDGISEPLGFDQGQVAGLNYGLTATFNVFNGFDRRRRTQTAQLRQAQARARQEQTELAVVTALESTYAIYERSLALVRLELENVEAANQNVRVAFERFRLGVSTSLELREVQRALTAARSRLAVTLFEAKQAEVDLLTLSSRLL